jgi:hypothetical protein
VGDDSVEIGRTKFVTSFTPEAASWRARIDDPNERPVELVKLWRSGADPELISELAPTVWIEADQPARDVGQDAWVRIFRDVGYTSRETSDAEFVAPIPVDAPPSKPVTVWRGAPLGSGGLGMSWTIDRERARWFAERDANIGVDSAVYEATVDPDGVLAMFNDRTEHEVVVDPAYLHLPLMIIEQAPGAREFVSRVFGRVRLRD